MLASWNGHKIAILSGENYKVANGFGFLSHVFRAKFLKRVSYEV
jgi:hypothetical protein